jgi:hypothetical protein
MKVVINKKDFIITLTSNDERKELKELKNNGELDSDDSMYEFFETLIANNSFEWISPEEINALTDAPILGFKDENGNITDVYWFPDYAVISPLQELLTDGKIIFQQG